MDTIYGLCILVQLLTSVMLIGLGGWIWIKAETIVNKGKLGFYVKILAINATLLLISIIVKHIVPHSP